MKKILFLILLSIVTSFNAQKKKAYYNEDMKEISKTEFFNQRDYSKNIDLYIEDQEQFNNILVRRKNHGKLSEIELKELQISLSGKKLDKNLIIIYYPGKDSYNTIDKNTSWNVFNKSNLKKLNRKDDYEGFWIYKDYDGLQYYFPDRVNWQPDKDGVIENLFFKNHYPFFSFVVIDKKGNYISYFSEFGKDTVWKLVKELKRTDSR
ncbi:hypothetical protein [Chryseobacterium herbae]|uniref:Uncharacterized protein n=1 Tax=Chryseobacterium herbae TaxID=2976476 RepID=A0ABT2IYA0_9FLAO|nr:hypothetical protein [Chryseobacterium sp. pc1-10]MCT2563290.1 hypothetical protein [Chryseobacterium sp. pc1-10]